MSLTFTHTFCLKLGYELKIAAFITESELRLWGEPSAAFQELEGVTGRWRETAWRDRRGGMAST